MPTVTNDTAVGAGVSKVRRRWALQVALAFFIPLLVLGMVEEGLRFGSVGFPTELLVPCTVQGRAAACYNLFFPAPFFPPGMIKTPAGLCHSGREGTGNVPHLRARRVGSDGRPRSRLFVQPISRSHAEATLSRR